MEILIALIVMICILDLIYEVYISIQEVRLMTYKEPEQDNYWSKLDKETIKMLKEINCD